MRRESVEELYGLLKEQEKRKESVLRDVRSFWERLFASLSLRRTATALFAAFALLCFVCPPCWPLALSSAAILFFGALSSPAQRKITHASASACQLP